MTRTLAAVAFAAAVLRLVGHIVVAISNERRFGEDAL